MAPRRYIFVLIAFVLIVIGLFSHPVSREHLQRVKDYGVEAISDLTKGPQSHHQPAVDEGENVDILPPSATEPDVSSPLSTELSKPTPSSHEQEQEQEDKDEHKEAVHEDELWTGDRWFFEGDNELYPLPKLQLNTLKAFAPHNYKGPGHETVAIFLATRNGSMQDSYFLAAQQQVYRILWDPRTKSRFCLTAFVAPFVHQDQRDFLAAAGAYVRELPLISWTPAYSLTSSPRWKDQFTKLNLWNQLDFSRILYLDTDAFPIKPFDALFDSVSESHECSPNLIPIEDRIDVEEMCNFTFTAARDPRGMLNAGMFMLHPNRAMHANLLRGIERDRDKFDNNIVEQGYLQFVFREDGPFPGQYVGREWNAIETQPEDEDHVNILHEKLWIFYFMPDHWALHYFNDTWMDMLELYESPRFLELRTADGPLKIGEYEETE